MPKKSIKQRLEKLENTKEADDIQIFVCERTDGYVDIPQPGGGFRTITEKQFIAEGNIIVHFGENGKG